MRVGGGGYSLGFRKTIYKGVWDLTKYEGGVRNPGFGRSIRGGGGF